MGLDGTFIIFILKELMIYYQKLMLKINENLNIKGLTKTWLSKSINDAIWGSIPSYSCSSAENAGVKT